jgi:threonine dehydrogenase-like Zn-dependent dehydrogenase
MGKTMKAAHMIALQQPLEVTHIPIPIPGKKDAIIRIEASGICRTDWHLGNGDWTFAPYPRYPDVFALIERGKLNPSSLITRQVALEDVSSVLQDMIDFKSIGFTMITNFD